MSGTAKYSPGQNLVDRQALLSTGVRMRANLGTQTANGPGQTIQFKLRNVGIITRLKARVTVNYTVAVATVTASPFGPYGFISKIDLLDYNTVDRHFSTGPLNYLLSSIRHGRPWMPTGQGLVDTAQTVQPVTTGAKVCNFNVEIPVAYDPHNDLTGAILAQTVVGEMFLRLQLNNTLIGDPMSPFVTDGGGGTVTITAVSVTLFQDYIMPQGSRPQIPLFDLNSVYEYAALYTSSDNIVAGGTKFLDYPNVRNVMGLFMIYVDNSTVTVNETDISQLVLVANGNTNMREQDPMDVRGDMRQMLGGDLPAGSYYIGSRRNPIQTFIYSQVQQAITFAAASGTSYLAYGFESVYPLATPLPGIAAGS